MKAHKQTANEMMLAEELRNANRKVGELMNLAQRVSRLNPNAIDADGNGLIGAGMLKSLVELAKLCVKGN